MREAFLQRGALSDDLSITRGATFCIHFSVLSAIDGADLEKKKKKRKSQKAHQRAGPTDRVTGYENLPGERKVLLRRESNPRSTTSGCGCIDLPGGGPRPLGHPPRGGHTAHTLGILALEGECVNKAYMVLGGAERHSAFWC